MDGNVVLRPGGAQDLPLLEAMLAEAFLWNVSSERPPLTELRQRPEFVQLFAGWGRAGDQALIAECGGTGAGAIWSRLWTADQHSYGFVDAHTPELGLGVARQYRRRGIARALLRALIEQAAAHGHPALSLSVAPDNPARRLYESEGFVKVGEVGTSWTLLRPLGT
jgi:ribosomal protein S18 acetylase RimI-like enzyme